jgi:hypothetical protein
MRPSNGFSYRPVPGFRCKASEKEGVQRFIVELIVSKRLPERHPRL